MWGGLRHDARLEGSIFAVVIVLSFHSLESPLGRHHVATEIAAWVTIYHT